MVNLSSRQTRRRQSSALAASNGSLARDGRPVASHATSRDRLARHHTTRANITHPFASILALVARLTAARGARFEFGHRAFEKPNFQIHASSSSSLASRARPRSPRPRASSRSRVVPLIVFIEQRLGKRLRGHGACVRRPSRVGACDGPSTDARRRAAGRGRSSCALSRTRGTYVKYTKRIHGYSWTYITRGLFYKAFMGV